MALAARQLERQPLARRSDLPPRPQRASGRVAGRVAVPASPRAKAGAAPRGRAAAQAAPRARTRAEQAPRPRVRVEVAPTPTPAAPLPLAPGRSGVRARVRVYVRRHGETTTGLGRPSGAPRRSAVGTRAHHGSAGSTRRARITAVAFADAAARAVPGDPLFDVVRGRTYADAIDPLVRASGAQLSVVPRPRRRGAVRALAVLCTLLVTVMMGAAAFQTQLARRQVELDRLDSDIHSAREQYEQLRRERAELRSPAHLSEVASDRGMVQATEAGFMVLTPEVLAEVQRSAGMIVGADDVEQEDPLQQFRDVKSVTDGAP